MITNAWAIMEKKKIKGFSHGRLLIFKTKKVATEYFTGTDTSVIEIKIRGRLDHLALGRKRYARRLRQGVCGKCWRSTKTHLRNGKKINYSLCTQHLKYEADRQKRIYQINR